MSWTAPRTWATKDSMTQDILNTHIRDNLSSLKSEHYATQTMRGVHLRSHPDSLSATSKVMLLKADELVMSDGTRLSVTTPLTADITASGANGLDTGTEQASTWYEIHAIAKDDGTKALMLHRSKDWTIDQSQTTHDTNAPLRFSSTVAKLAQGFKLSQAGTVPWIDMRLMVVGAPTGSIWLTIEADASGSPSGTPLATSDKLDVSKFSTAGYVVRFMFRTPVSLSATPTQYHVVIQGDFAISATNYVNVRYNSAGGYANGAYSIYNGSTWSSGATDLYFRVALERNNTALTFPTGYTKSCKVGYVYNNGSSNFQPFAALNQSVHALHSNAYAIVASASTPSLTDITTLVPPVPVFVDVAIGLETATRVGVAPVPDGYALLDTSVVDTTYGALIYYQYTAPPTAPDVAYPHAVMGRLHTEAQAVYVNVGTNARLFFRSWEWIF